MNDHARALVAFTTCGDELQAAELARVLVERRVAACVNIVPHIRSLYRWQGEVCDDVESMLIIKTNASTMPALKETLAQAHAYELPELIALDVADGSDDYLAWVGAQLA
jgi:periplasmic divalent cation tolerance protein